MPKQTDPIKIRVPCEHCKRVLLIPVVRAGTTIRCNCGVPLTVPKHSVPKPANDPVVIVPKIAPPHHSTSMPENESSVSAIARHLAAMGVLPKDPIFAREMAEHVLRVMTLLGVPVAQLIHSDEAFRQAITNHGLLEQHLQEIAHAIEYAGEYSEWCPPELKDDLVETLVDAARARLGGRDLADILESKFAEYNIDWEEIAETERASTYNNGCIRTQPIGSFVLGQTMPEACEWCRKNIHGKVLKVVASPGPDEDPLLTRDWDREIWVGKSNRGRYQDAVDPKTGEMRPDAKLWKPAPLPHVGATCFWMAFDPRFHNVDEKTGRMEVKPEIMERYRNRTRRP